MLLILNFNVFFGKRFCKEYFEKKNQIRIRNFYFYYREFIGEKYVNLYFFRDNFKLFKLISKGFFNLEKDKILII